MKTVLEKLELPGGNNYLNGQLPAEIIPDQVMFDRIGAMHPAQPSKLKFRGREVEIPRYDKAYGRDYAFSGSVAQADPVPDILAPFLTWVRENVEPTANGLFINWHDPDLNHYHGHHRDKVNGLVRGTPITTISLGDTRIFRLLPFPSKRPVIDIEFRNGDVVVIPWETNKHWYHEIPKLARNRGRRISVTARSFQ